MLKRLIRKVWHFITDKQEPLDIQAIKAGVHLGSNNLIESTFWTAAEPYLIKIGNNCQITHNVLIFTHGGGNVVRFKYPKFDCFGKVTIGDYVYIGSGALIMPGVTIEDHVLVAAGSVVTKSIRKDSVVAGNPARFICTIDEYIERNISYNINTKGLSIEEKKIILENLDKSKFISKNYI